MSITRLTGETDEELRIHTKKLIAIQVKKSLKFLLTKLGLKSAKALPGIYVDFRGMTIHKPGAYTRITNVQDNQ